MRRRLSSVLSPRHYQYQQEGRKLTDQALFGVPHLYIISLTSMRDCMNGRRLSRGSADS
jgi:hypothetical protein